MYELENKSEVICKEKNYWHVWSSFTWRLLEPWEALLRSPRGYPQLLLRMGVGCLTYGGISKSDFSHITLLHVLWASWAQCLEPLLSNNNSTKSLSVHYYLESAHGYLYIPPGGLFWSAIHQLPFMITAGKKSSFRDYQFAQCSRS